MDSDELLQALTAGLQKEEVASEGLSYSREITGGIVNKSALFTSTTNKFLVKWNTKPCTIPMFKAEQESLRLLGKTQICRIPSSFTVCADNTESGGLQAIEFIDNLQPVTRWRQLAEVMTRLHSFNTKLQLQEKTQSGRVCSSGADVEENPSSSVSAVYKFGFHCAPYLGNFTPGPVWRDTWQEYFVKDILQGLFDMAEKQYGIRTVSEGWAELQQHVHKVFQGEEIRPQLLHGDFWLGNIGQTKTDIVMFDPSCLYGDPHFDLVIVANEPGIEEEFLSVYHELLPPGKNYSLKMSLYKLFYNLIMWCHVNEANFREGTLDCLKTLNKRLPTC